MKFRWMIVGVVAALTLSACGSDDDDGAGAVSTEAAAATEASDARKTTTETTDEATTDAPTTTKARETTVPTTTAAPTTAATTTTAAPTTTLPPAPLVFDGSGSTVLDLGQTLSEAKLLVASNDGSSNFIVTAKSDKLEDQGNIINEIGPTAGTYTLNLRDNDRTRYLEIDAEGNWHFEIKALTDARPWGGEELTGVGNDVVVYTGKPGLLDYSNDGDSNFIVTDLRRDLVINEIGPISGTTTIPEGPLLVTIDAEGNWTMTVRPV
jgi:hypothetical protein